MFHILQAAEEVASESKEAKIEEIQHKLEWIKNNLKSTDTPIHEIFSSNSPKRDLILKWGQYLEELAGYGVYKKPLSTISTTITEELREMKLYKSIAYVRVALPNKYKDSSKDHSEEDQEYRANDSRENSSNYRKENLPYIKRLLRTAELLDAAAQKLEKSPLMSKLKEREIEEYFVRWDNSLQQLSDVLDGREKVPLSKQAIFMYCCSLATGNHIYAEFVNHIRDFARFTSKQAGKIIEGRVTKLTLLYEPKNRLQAIDVGYYGFPCDWCGSWRCKPVKRKKNNITVLNCFACGEDSELKTEALPDK